VVQPQEGGRRGEIDERSGAPARLAMAAGDGGLDSAAKRLNRARGGAEQVRGEAAQLGAQRNEAARRATAGARPGDKLCSVWLSVSARKEKRGGEMDEAHARDKNGVAQRARIAGARDAWSRRRSVAAWARYGHRGKQEETVVVLTNFDRTLTN